MNLKTAKMKDHSDRQPAGPSEWDLVIRPSAPIFSLPLGEIWQYRDVLYLMTRRDIVAFYKQTILGPIWFLIQPICTTIIFMVIFGQIARLSTDGIPQFAFYLSGIALWNYFSDCFNKTAMTFRDNATLFGKVYFPRIIVPLSIVISNLVRFAIQFSLFGAVWVWYISSGEITAHATILYFPLVVLTMATLGLSGGMLLSAMTTKYRDLVFLMQFGVQLLLYATPVIYPFSEVPDHLKAILGWNPLNPLFEITRHGFLGAGQVSAADLGYSVSFAIALLGIAVITFNRVERTYMDTV